MRASSRVLKSVRATSIPRPHGNYHYYRCIYLIIIIIIFAPRHAVPGFVCIRTADVIINTCVYMFIAVINLSQSRGFL